MYIYGKVFFLLELFSAYLCLHQYHCSHRTMYLDWCSKPNPKLVQHMCYKSWWLLGPWWDGSREQHLPAQRCKRMGNYCTTVVIPLPASDSSKADGPGKFCRCMRCADWGKNWALVWDRGPSFRNNNLVSSASAVHSFYSKNSLKLAWRVSKSDINIVLTQST